jgi:hypothetical protein
MTSAHVTSCINEILPAEVFGVIFEEHAKLEWRAPVIDGQVCRLWRETILRSPRAWAHLEIKKNKPAPLELRKWLDRSGISPLHIRVIGCTPGMVEVLDQHHKKFEFLAVYDDSYSCLENRSFPTLQSLIFDIHRSPNWNTGSGMPALRSLQARYNHPDTLPLNSLPPLRFLALCKLKNCERFIRNSYHSLTSLLLERLEFHDASESLEFPSLRFLSLYNVYNLKPRMNVPALTTYHEGDEMEAESFPMSLPLLAEYGTAVWYNKPLVTATHLHECYPNLSRLSIRASPAFFKPFLLSLVGRPTALPMLKILAVGAAWPLVEYSKEDKLSMVDDVLVRNMASSVKMELCFDRSGLFRVPLYFGAVRLYIKEDRNKLISTLRIQIGPIEGLAVVLGL